MTPKPLGRWGLLLLALSATAWLTDGAPNAARPNAKPAQAPVAPTPSRAGSRIDEPIEPVLPRTALYGALQETGRVDLFAARAPLVPPQASPAQVAAPLERAPVQPLPAPPSFDFKVLGKKQQAGGWEVFLEREGRTVFARTNALIEGGFHVDEIEPPTMKLTHVATRTPITVSVGEAR